MIPPFGAYLRRSALAAILGGLAGVACTVLMYSMRPAIDVRFDRDLPSQVGGFYPVERNDRGYFAWTTATAEIVLPGLDRREPWVWTINARAARPDPRTFPDVTLAVDGVAVPARRLGNTFERISVDVPVRSTDRGATLTIQVRPPFSPGPDDPRALGIQINELTVAPAPATVVVVPPRQVLAAASLNAAVFGAAFGLLGVTPGSAVGGALALAAVQSVPLTSGFGPFTPYAARAMRLAVWIALFLILFVWAVQRVRGHPLRNTARFAAACSAAALYLELLVLLHPDKAIVDAVFHAHKLGGILQGGTLLMTSIAPGGYQFPYPAMLYLAAVPFTTLTSDHVVLLRLLTAVASAVAGVFVYVMVNRIWGDRLAGAGAVALYHLVPIGFAVQASANLSNSFGQSLTLMTIAAMVVGNLGRWPNVLALSALMTAAFLSHTSSFAILAGIGVATGLAFLWSRHAPLIPPGRAILIATTVAMGASIVLFYGHFGELYRDQLATFSSGAHPAGSASPTDRLASVPRLVSTYFGLAFVMLAAWGAYQLWRMRARDRLGLALLAWLTTCALFLLVGLVTPLDFRHYLAAYPAVALLAAFGAANLWRTGGISRIVAGALLAWCAIDGVSGWFGQL